MAHECNFYGKIKTGADENSTITLQILNRQGIKKSEDA